MLRAARLLLLLLGLGVAAALVWEHRAAVGEAMVRVGWGFGLYMAASFLLYALDTWGWRAAFMAKQPHVPFGRLFNVRMAGEAVNKITPLASLGGEPLKAYLLARDGASLADAAASVTVSKNTMTLAQIAFIGVGLVMAWGRLPGQEGPLTGLAIFPCLVLAVMLVVSLLDLQLRRRRARGSTQDGEPSGKLRRGGAAAMAVWAQVADFMYAHPGAFALSVFFFLLGWVAGVLELLVGAYILGFDLALRDALIMEAILMSVNMAAFFIPAQLGSQEAGFVYSGKLLGLTATQGVELAVLRRCRDVVWIAFGLLYLAATEGRIMIQPQEVAPSER